MVFPEPPAGEAGESLPPVVLRFPGEMAYRVYDEFEGGQIQVQEDGDLLVTASMPQDPWLTGFLLSFGPRVQVVSPVYLRDILAAQAKEIYEKNGGSGLCTM